MMGRKGHSLSEPGVGKAEVFRARSTRNPLHLDNVRVPRSIVESGNASEAIGRIMGVYQKSAAGKTPLHAHGIPEIVFDEKSITHDFSRKNMTRQKLSIVTDHERMNHLLSRGTVLEKKIKMTSRSGKELGSKKTWAHFWEVKGRVFIGNKDHTYTFSVYRRKDEGGARVYDFKIRENK